MKVWYTIVWFGSGPYKMPPVGPWQTREDAENALNRWRKSVGANAGTIESAHNFRIYGYKTRGHARLGNISDEPGGRYGRLE